MQTAPNAARPGDDLADDRHPIVIDRRPLARRLKSTVAGLTLAGTIALSLIGTPAQSHAEGFAVAPHVALYEVNLLETRMGGVTRVEGAMSLSITAACDAWTVESDLGLIFGNAENEGAKLRVQHKGRESVSGETFEFRTDVYTNDSLSEIIRGEAKRGSDGHGEAFFTMPEEKTLPLPAETEFPLSALSKSLGAFFEQNQRLINYVYFDGTDMGVDRATDLLAGTPEPIQTDQQDPDGLLSAEALRVVTTMFDFSKTDAEPNSTFVGDLMANGVVARLTIDLGFILVEARLSEVKATPLPTDCS